MSNFPSTHGSNGQGPNGRFLPGNKLGRGNPLAGRAAKLRSAALAAVTVTDMRKIMKTMVSLAISGDTTAAKFVYGYSIGEPVAHDLMELFAELQNLMREKGLIDGSTKSYSSLN